MLKKSALPPADKAEAEAFEALVRDAKGVVEAARHGKPDEEHLITTMVGTRGKFPRLYATKTVYAQSEEEALYLARTRSLGDRKGKLTSEDAEFFAGMLSWQGDGYNAQAGAVRAQRQEVLQAQKAEEDAERAKRNAIREDLRKRYEFWKADGDHEMVKALKAMLATA